MKNLFTLLILLFIFSYSYAQTLELEQISFGFSSPVDIVHSGDERLFIVERSGVIKIIPDITTGDALATPFLDINSIVHNANFQSEQGLLGLAFHPDYANNGYFFVNYTDNSDATVVARYTRDANDPNIADPNSAEIIITFDQPASNHNGGCLRFGPDGYLYIGTGDGGSGNDPWNNSQDTQTFLGKMLRLDIDNGLPYTVPSTNPFINDASVLDEIWAIGLRNPWKFSFDKETGDLWIADVGQNAWEEIDFQPANSAGGENYGWRCYEGNHLNTNVNTSDCPPQSDLVDPIYEIPHQGFNGPCSITGGYVYRGTENPDLIGKYIVADFCSGEFFIVEPDGNGGWVGQEVNDFNFDISTFGEDVNGELYAARLSNGNIYKIKSDLCASLMANVNVTSEPCEGELNGTAELTVAGGLAPYTLPTGIDFNNLPPDNYSITVSDDNGCMITTNFTINTLPLPTVPTITVNDFDLTAPSGLSAYQWFLDGVAIAGQTDETISVTQSGNYSVMVTGANGCSNTSVETNIIFSGLEAIPELSDVNISPNPFDKNIVVEIEVKETVNLSIEILDVAGKKLYSNLVTVNEKLTQSIDLGQLSVGVYYLNLESEEGIVVKKIVKQ